MSNLLLLTALATGRSVVDVAGEFGAAGASGLKRALTEALNERLRPIRARRRELMRDPGYLRGVLAQGNERVRSVAGDTLAAVRRLMHTSY